jgi:hypothetical protein
MAGYKISKLRLISIEIVDEVVEDDPENGSKHVALPITQIFRIIEGSKQE